MPQRPGTKEALSDTPRNTAVGRTGTILNQAGVILSRGVRPAFRLLSSDGTSCARPYASLPCIHRHNA